MTDLQIRGLGPAFSAYLRPFHAYCNQERTTPHFDAYCHALLSDAPRKTAEPNALASGTAVRTLQKFLTTTDWDHYGVRDAFQKQMSQILKTCPKSDPLGTVGIIDETSCLKKGDKTPGVQRQYLGCVGKVDNGIVTVHLAVSRGTFRTLLDADLYLPNSWDEDRGRCEAAGIPEEKRYEPKWKIALEQLKRCQGNGVSFDWLTFDEGYGSKPEFVQSLVSSGQKFSGEIPKNFMVSGRSGSSRRVDMILPASRASQGKRCRLKRETCPNQIWQASGTRVRVGDCWMFAVVAVSVTTGEVKYFLVSGTTSVRMALRVGFRRWTVEHLFRVAKQEVGLMHYEGRKYQGLMRHLILSLLVLGFVSIQTDRLRGEKSGDHIGAGESSVESALSGAAGSASSRLGFGACGDRDSLSSDAECGRSQVASQTNA